jgi:hypothetical protein
MIGPADFQPEKHTKLVIHAVLLLVLITSLPGYSQAKSGVEDFFRNNIGLTDEEIAAIQSGKAVVRALPSRRPAEVFLFGAVYIHAAPERYFEFTHDFDRLRNIPNYLALGVFSNPPQLADLTGFSFDEDDVKALRNCRPGDCLIQMPASSMEHIQGSIDWSAPDVNQQVNELLRKGALERLLQYQREGNQALGVYHDKRSPTDVPQQFAYILSYVTVLPERLPDFYHYLLAYPENKPPNIQDAFYWAKLKFGLKPTLRIVQLTSMRGSPGDPIVYAIAEKQLYSSHYFGTALDLSFCVRENPSDPGFYLIKELGSEQAGLTGVKGSIVRKAAVGRSLSSLQNALTEIRKTLHQGEPP